MIRPNLKKYFYAALTVALLIIFHYAGILSPFEALAGRLLKPLAGGFYSVSAGVGGALRAQTSKVDLAEKLRAAEELVNRLTAENVGLKFLQEENAALRKSLNFLKTGGGRYLVANIISRGELTGGQEGQTVIIDKGSRDGLFAGLPVVSSAAYATSSQGIIIGKVVNVKEQMAEVYLVTDKNCKLAAAILGENKTSGIVRGELGLTVKMEFIPQTQNLKIGDAVATSGLEKNIPRGLVIGRVSGLVKENNELWQSATIEPLVNLDNLTIISVLLP